MRELGDAKVGAGGAADQHLVQPEIGAVRKVESWRHRNAVRVSIVGCVWVETIEALESKEIRSRTPTETAIVG